MSDQSLPAVELPATAELVAQIVRHLSDGRAVHVTGLPGSGRSHLLRRVQDELSMTGGRSLEVRGSRAFSDRPLAALTLAGIAVDGGPQSGGGGALLSRAADALEKVMSRPQILLVVDDAAQLDRLSAGVIAAVRARKRFPLLFASRPVVDPGGSLDALVAAAQPGVEVNLGPLRLEQIQTLVHGLLPGVAEPGTIAQLATLSGGLPGLLMAVVDVACRSGRLSVEDGVWRAHGELWSDRLGLALRPFLSDLGSDEVDALAVLARAGSVTAEQAGELVAPGLVGRFVRLGLVRSDLGLQRAGLYVYPPALAELLRRAGASASEPDVLRRSPVRLRSGWRAHALAGADAAAFADRVLDHWRTETAACWKAWKADPTPTNATPLLSALRSSGAGNDEIETVLSETREDAQNPVAAAHFAIWVAIYQVVVGHDLPGALAALDSRRERLPQLDALLRTYEAHLTLIHARVPDRHLLAPPTDSDDPIGAEAIVSAQVEALMASGRTVEAAELLASHHPVSPRVASITRLFRGLVRVLGDDVAGGVEWALDGFGDAMDALDPGMIAAHGYVAALGMTMLGTFEELDSVVEVAFRLSGAAPLQGHYRAGLFQLASIVAGWQGRTEYARSLAVQAGSFRSGDGPFPGMLEALRLLEDPSHTADQLWDVVDDRLERDYLASAVFLAVRAVEDDTATTRAEQVIKRGGASQSRVLRTLAGYISAVVSHDLATLAQVIDELREYCGPLYAVRASITRALLLRDDEDFDGWLAQTDAAWREGDGLGRRCEGMFARIVRAVNLTQREEEVVVLAAQGRSAMEIAESTDVTRRTAETHIQTAYRKIGVRNRQELRQVIATWLAL